MIVMNPIDGSLHTKTSVFLEVSDTNTKVYQVVNYLQDQCSFDFEGEPKLASFDELLQVCQISRKELLNILGDTRELARLQILPLFGGTKFAHVTSKTLWELVASLLTLLNGQKEFIN